MGPGRGGLRRAGGAEVGQGLGWGTDAGPCRELERPRPRARGFAAAPDTRGRLGRPLHPPWPFPGMREPERPGIFRQSFSSFPSFLLLLFPPLPGSLADPSCHSSCPRALYRGRAGSYRDSGIHVLACACCELRISHGLCN